MKKLVCSIFNLFEKCDNYITFSGWIKAKLEKKKKILNKHFKNRETEAKLVKRGVIKTEQARKQFVCQNEY